MKQNIFVNYRHSDVPIVAQFVVHELAKRLGAEHVFFDRKIDPGSNYITVLKDAVSKCDVLLSLIGAEWLNKENKKRLRLDDDWVRVEIAAALSRGIRVIPVLVGGVKKPEPVDLPEDLAPLSNFQTVSLAEDDIWPGMNRLLDVLEKDLGLHKPKPHKDKVHTIDELLRKARLIKADADQLLLDQMSKSQQFRFENEGTSGIATGGYVAGHDNKAHTEKLGEAFQLLQKAAELDDTNPEVMLATAELLIELTPDDPSDEQRLLFKIKSLLSDPKNDTERFQLAKATFLMATTGENVHYASLQDAMAIFEQLGRVEWVRQCDELLSREFSQTTPENDYSSVPPDEPSVPQDTHPQMPTRFQPAGRWRICDAAFCPSTWIIDFFPNGGFQGQQETPAMGIFGPVTGQWGFDPNQSAFHIQGILNGMVPFGTTIYIQRHEGNIWFGTGMDGMPYSLAPVSA